MAAEVASGRDVKMEDAAPTDPRAVDSKPSYRSWKKKYRKMKIKFDQKQFDGEELHKQEQKALETSKRLAVEIDRLLDILVDVNNTPQIPIKRRFDLSLALPDSSAIPHLDIDDPQKPSYVGPEPGSSLKQLLADVPHLSYQKTLKTFPELVADLETPTDQRPAAADAAAHPPQHPCFLTADDIDNYIWEADMRIAAQARQHGRKPPVLLPTLAPAAHTDQAAATASSHRDAVLRNPTSVYNWLRKNAPKTFLQDGESGGGGGPDKDADDHAATTGGGRSRKSMGAGGAERGGSGAGGKGGARSSKRASTGPNRAEKRAAAAAAAAAGADESMDDEAMAEGLSTPMSATAGGGSGGAKGKRKRAADDDAGYRPKGGSSRPSKKKRKSEGGGGDTPTGGSGSKKARKSVDAGEAGETDDAKGSARLP